MSTEKEYAKEMKKGFGGYYATWTPGVPVELGDIGVLQGNVFTKTGNVKETFGLDFDVRPDVTFEQLEHKSQSCLNVVTKLSGQAAPAGSSLAIADSGIFIQFGNQHAVYFKADNVLSPAIKDCITLGASILSLYNEGKWRKEWVVITEVQQAKSTTILISNSSNASIDLKANATVPTSGVDAAAGVSLASSHNLHTSIVAQEGLTPLFKLMGVRKRFLRPPVIVHHIIENGGNDIFSVPAEYVEFSEVAGEDWN